ncbi:hypothetical protein HGQ17_07705 [Nesterenkonia sp. MY13]|uniref:Uncharacterized protein n=1 Tax=Nesterenkonia sedimenti TaxID=1463632 RepID=A0A7X8TJM5_9MICC|nr:hypothetical protein [Nesterenkonia sedimenti]NLS09888.1 hypothetical protein [Nesterenkonia sedimenti]
MSEMKLDDYEKEVLEAYELEELESSATPEKLEWLREAARVTLAKGVR